MLDRKSSVSSHSHCDNAALLTDRLPPTCNLTLLLVTEVYGLDLQLVQITVI